MSRYLRAATRLAAGALVLATLACGGDQTASEDPAAEAGSLNDPASPAAATIAGAPDGDLSDWVEDVREGLTELPERAGEPGFADVARDRVVTLYISRQEFIERYYGAGGVRAGSEELANEVELAEVRFHDLIRMTGGEAAPAIDDLEAATTRLLDQLEAVERMVAEENLDDPSRIRAAAPAEPGDREEGASRAELEQLSVALDEAAAAYREGQPDLAATRLQTAYLDQFEPLEPLLPGAAVSRIENLIHLRLRPEIAREAPVQQVDASFVALQTELDALETASEADSPALFGAANAFLIIFREGLEAVLLVGAILAFLAKAGEGRYQKRVYLGVLAGIAASFATWWVARALIPVSGASREIIEGVTALAAVAVLLYVSNSLFKAQYLYGWKRYLETHLGKALTASSGLAMAGLAFAAVYREGFETVLFYQALLGESTPGPVLGGFLAGAAVILAVAFAIVKLGVRLPLKQVFALTNLALIYLAWVFLGAGLYALQEAGLYVARPVSWVPDSQLLRQLLGFYPDTHTIIAQLGLVALIITTYLIYRQRKQSLAHAA